jgi:hypothetical protein
MFDTIHDAADDPVAASALNRPDRLNALTRWQRRPSGSRLSAPKRAVGASL